MIGPKPRINLCPAFSDKSENDFLMDQTTSPPERIQALDSTQISAKKALARLNEFLELAELHPNVSKGASMVQLEKLRDALQQERDSKAAVHSLSWCVIIYRSKCHLMILTRYYCTRCNVPFWKPVRHRPLLFVHIRNHHLRYRFSAV